MFKEKRNKKEKEKAKLSDPRMNGGFRFMVHFDF